MLLKLSSPGKFRKDLIKYNVKSAINNSLSRTDMKQKIFSKRRKNHKIYKFIRNKQFIKIKVCQKCKKFIIDL